jgi:hypothetical protein
MTRCLAVAIALVGIAVGCSGDRPSDERPQKKVFELTMYPLDREGWVGTGSSIRQIDPDTLEPVTRHGLRLGGYSERPALSPDREQAVFSTDFGELVFVDLPKMEVRERLSLGSHDLVVAPIGWPRKDLLYALVCTALGGKTCGLNRLLLVDPTGPKQVAAIDLNGGASGRYDWTSRRAVILVSPKSVKPARLLVAEPSGSIHEVELSRILVGTKQRRFGPHMVSAALVVGGGRAIVLGTRGLIADVSLKSRRVRYHRIPQLSTTRVDMRGAVSERWGGTVSPTSDETVFAKIAWPGTLLVLSARSVLSQQGQRVRRSNRTHLLDTQTWISRQAPSSYMLRAADVLITSRGRAYRDPRTILAYERSGAVRYRLRLRGLMTYSTYGDRLYVGRINGRKTRIYDARTGRLLHRRSPTEVEPAFTWTPPG